MQNSLEGVQLLLRLSVHLGQLVGGTVSPVAVAGGQGGGARVSEGGGWEG